MLLEYIKARKNHIKTAFKNLGIKKKNFNKLNLDLLKFKKSHYPSIN
jgi:hypothetical protein